MPLQNEECVIGLCDEVLGTPSVKQHSEAVRHVDKPDVSVVLRHLEAFV